MKTIRETMREKGVLKDFLKSHKYDPGQKYRFGNLGDFSVLDEPMSYMDVSATIARMPGTLLPRRRAPCLQAWASLPLPSLLWVTVQRIGKCPSDLTVVPIREHCGSPEGAWSGHLWVWAGTEGRAGCCS